MLPSRANLYLCWEVLRNSGLIFGTSFYTFLAAILPPILPPILVTGFLCSQDGRFTWGLLAHLLGPICISVIGMSSTSSEKYCLHPFWVPHSGGGLYSLALHQFREEHSWNLPPACCRDSQTSPLAPQFPANVLLPFVRHCTEFPKPCFLEPPWLGTVIYLHASSHTLRNKCWHRIKYARISLVDTPEWKELGWEMEKVKRPFRSRCTVTYSEGEKGRRWKLLICPSVWGRFGKAVVRAYQPQSPIKGVLCVSGRGLP